MKKVFGHIDKGIHYSLSNWGIKNPAGYNIITEEIKMKAKVHEVVVLKDGSYVGEIIDIQYREEPYNYVDIVVREKESGKGLKVGVPFYVAENSKLGEMLIRFGAELKPDKEIEVEDFIKVGSYVDFITMMKKGKGDNKDKEFCNIIPQSLKPHKE